MTNGDRIRTFSDEHLALIIMCLVESCLTYDSEEITQLRKNGKCIDRYGSCEKCCFEWLKQEETQCQTTTPP